MIDRAFRGSPRYHLWLLLLLSLSSLALFLFTRQLREGLTITAMSQDVPWGFYIAQLTFLVGVAASAVMVVLPYYLHDFKVFGKITILGEFLAVPAVLLCPLFVAVDLGQPSRVMNIFFHPQLNSMLFWDTVALGGYLVLNLIIGFVIPRIDNAGHMGGLVGGAAVAALLGDRLMPWSRQFNWSGPVMVVVSTLLLGAPLLIAVITQ